MKHTTALLITLLSSCAGAADAAQDTRCPNVLLIYTDDQGTLDVNCFGSKDLHTPHLDALAKRGIRFTQAYAHTVCCPSRAPLLTGRYPQRCNVNTWTPCHPDPKHPFGKGPNMRLEEVTLAEALKPLGYRTALFGKWHLGAHDGFGPIEQGFDEFFGFRGGFIDNYTHEFLHGADFHDLYRGKTEVHEDGKFFPDLIVRESLRFLEENKGRPFFMYTAFNVPHYPEQFDPKFAEMYKDMPMPRRSYAAFISTLDDRIGQILGKIAELGLRDNTLVIFMSDNGHSIENSRNQEDGRNYGANGGGGNTGKWRGAKGTFYEGGIRVPAIISWPGHIPQGEARGQPVMNLDFFPTVLEACGAALPKRKIDGVSLWPMLKSADAPAPHKVMHWQWGNRWAVRQGDWKLIGGFLGNLAEDEPERENHAGRQAEIVKRLAELHEAWAKDVFDK